MAFYCDNALNMRLDGKIALVTGAAQGIGYAIAQTLGRKGAVLALVDKSAQLDAVCKEFQDSGVKAKAVVANITNKAEVERVVEEVESALGPIDILVNNAGIVRLDNAEVISEKMWDDTMAINLKAHFLMSQAVGKRMIGRKAGKIVNIASQGAVIALPKHIAYCASKAAVVSMTQVCALEWAPYGVNVNAVSPTVVMTELGKQAWAGQVGEDMKQMIPARRFAEPDEVAAAVLYLASPLSDMVNGANLVIDGGFTIQ